MVCPSNKRFELSGENSQMIWARSYIKIELLRASLKTKFCTKFKGVHNYIFRFCDIPECMLLAMKSFV